MTPARLIECLEAIRWTPLGLADALQSEVSVVVAWLHGREAVPASIGEWLEILARAHHAAPPPRNWRVDTT